MNRKWLYGVGLGLSLLGMQKAQACTTVVVGNQATKDGSTMIARNEDVSTHHAKYFKVYPAKTNKQKEFHANINKFHYPIPKKALRYTGMPDYNEKEGYFLEGGINEKNVAMSATESAKTNDKIQKIDPFVKDGIDEASMLNVVLPYIHSPKEGVERLGKIVEEKGSTAPNGIIFSDKNEIWYMEIGSGHQWVAQRVPSNTYAVIPNKLVLGNIDFKDHKNFMYSKSLPQFAKKHHLLKDGKLNFAKAFGTDDKEDAKYNYPRIWAGQRLLTPSKKQKITSRQWKTFMKPDEKITIDKVGRVLGDHFDGTKYDTMSENKGGYRAINVATNVESHILQLRPNQKKSLTGIQWMAMASPSTSVYVPFYTDIKGTPKAYQKGNGTYSTDSAYWTYKLTTLMGTTYHNALYKDHILPVKEKVQAKLEKNLAANDKKAKSYKGNLATYLTKCNDSQATWARKQFTTLNNECITIATTQTNDKHNSHL